MPSCAPGEGTPWAVATRWTQQRMLIRSGRDCAMVREPALPLATIFAAAAAIAPCRFRLRPADAPAGTSSRRCGVRGSGTGHVLVRLLSVQPRSCSAGTSDLSAPGGAGEPSARRIGRAAEVLDQAYRRSARAPGWAVLTRNRLARARQRARAVAKAKHGGGVAP
jgi:hypothetical protein